MLILKIRLKKKFKTRFNFFFTSFTQNVHKRPDYSQKTKRFHKYKLLKKSTSYVLKTDLFESSLSLRNREALCDFLFFFTLNTHKMQNYNAEIIENSVMVSSLQV
jgi:hypothetical protein